MLALIPVYLQWSSVECLRLHDGYSVCALCNLHHSRCFVCCLFYMFPSKLRYLPLTFLLLLPFLLFAISFSLWAAPNRNRQLTIAVGIVGPEPAMSGSQGPLPDNGQMPCLNMCHNICQINTIKDHKTYQIECQIECQPICQIHCHNL